MRLIISFCLSLLLGVAAVAEPRMALVIGNSDYAVLPLTNPVYDAEDMGKALKKYQFTVLSPVLNANQQTMEAAIQNFVDQIPNGGTALFYYSGHGIEVGGKNYMLPIGRNFKDAADVREYALSVNWVLDKMRSSGAKVNIVILDACLEEKKGSSNTGFAQMDATGVIVSYATTQGKPSLGAKGQRNSVYTGSLLNVLQGNSGHLPIERVFKEARNAVVKNTEFFQVPTTLEGLVGDDFCFGICGSGRIDPPRPPVQPPLKEPPPLKECDYCPEMVTIPSGSFRMGSNDGSSDEKPVHQVNMRSFAMGKYEVTFEEYDRFAQATGREKPDDEGWGRGNRPVINISWFDAVAYTEWLSQQTGKAYRLPTEAEWEYAARAGNQGKWSFGNDESQLGNYAWYDGNSGNKTHPVGEKKPNAFGLHDVVGNVWEWTCSEYVDSYNGKEQECIGKNRAKDNYMSLRGGSWVSSAYNCRVASRLSSSPSGRFSHYGFRVVLR